MKIKKHLEGIVRFDPPYLDRNNFIRLDRNERPVSWPEDIWREIQKIITPDVILSYPEIGKLYLKLAATLKVDADMLLLSHGSDVGLKSIFEAYIKEGDEALSLSPSYAMYPVYAQMVGAKPVEVAFDEDLSMPFDKIIRAISDRTRIICLANPNQPIERVFSKGELTEIALLSSKKDFILVVDEAYYYFYSETFSGSISEYPNLIISRSFSKVFGLAGLRAGLIISNKGIINGLKKVKPISEINNVAVKLIDYFLDHMDIIYAYANDVRLGRNIVQERARKLNIRSFGEAGNSLLLEFADADKVREIVAKAGQSGYLLKGPFCFPAQRHLRITLGPPEMMNQVMNVIERSLDA